MDGLILKPAALRKIKAEIASGIRKKVASSAAKGVVVGLSGGIDSSVAAKIARDARVDVYGLMMPETGVSAARDLEDAINLAEKLKIKYQVIELDRILTSVRNRFMWKDFPKNRLRSWGNVKARARMTLLYLTANLDNRLVLGTGNRTELLLGYFTKYGDGGVDLLPIGGLYKTQVRQLARYVGIPGSICRKTPTAGLWLGQTDEGEIGLEYSKVDAVLHLLYDKGLPLNKTAERTKLPESRVRQIKRRVGVNRHKREMPEIINPLAIF